MGKIRKRGTCRGAFKKLYIMTLPSVFILDVILFVYDNPMLFKKNEDVHERNTRRKGELRNKICNLQLSRRNVMHLGALFYNAMPLRLKESKKSRDNFKKDVKHYLIMHCFYSIDEFLKTKDCKCNECT
jgi:hypothetical protein